MATATRLKNEALASSSIPIRIAYDLTSAICASSLIAPIITIIDKSIILRTHNPLPMRSLLADSFRSALRRPGAFLISPPYLLISTLYFLTYTAANVTDTISSVLSKKPASTVTAGPQKFLATTATNMAACLYKDAQFARLYGAASAGAKRAVPKRTLALFAARDSLTVFASFNIPPLLGPVLGSAAAAQFLAPASVQIISTPLHLLGLDIYNRPKLGRGIGAAVPWNDRWRVIKRDWMAACGARIGRIVPAFGVGGVVNASVRKRLMGTLE